MATTKDGISASASLAARDLRVAISRIRRRIKRVYDTRDLTPSQLSVLSRLTQEQNVSASDLAAAEQVRPQSMAAILSSLAERDMIERRPDPNDGRKQLISLSETGREHIRVSRRARDEWLTRSMQDLYTEDERRTINDALTLLERLTDT
ncbi:MarR family winged helix-turn-helix transcriptional regulator [Antrihabitans cavernicola]|uniref:MarR family transcriptional regulator n=1 Tax=Antrihabitans cavernicola TaxID=2495913 RepID=A0A5A7S802_9NOCA|nr:MarR family transcriptional regulator [Spelaeibacter cavernicola]KAA0022288.1 MarR family transcriptional regulator [Spelaeibacter cavernicola]